MPGTGRVSTRMESNAREAHLRDLRACEHRGLMMSDEERNLRLGSVRGDSGYSVHSPRVFSTALSGVVWGCDDDRLRSATARDGDRRGRNSLLCACGSVNTAYRYRYLAYWT